MSAFGIVLAALGVLTIWAGLKRVMVQDVLKSLVATPQVKPTPAPKKP